MILKTDKMTDLLKKSKYKVIGYQTFADGIPYGLINIEIFKDRGIIHACIDKWTSKTARECKKDWERILRCLRTDGITQLEIRKEFPDETWCKFVKMLGFEELRQITISRRNI